MIDKRSKRIRTKLKKVSARNRLSVFRSNNVTGIFALQRCAAIPLPIVPDPITTTFLMSIKCEHYNKIYLRQLLI